MRGVITLRYSRVSLKLDRLQPRVRQALQPRQHVLEETVVVEAAIALRQRMHSGGANTSRQGHAYGVDERDRVAVTALSLSRHLGCSSQVRLEPRLWRTHAVLTRAPGRTASAAERALAVGAAARPRKTAARSVRLSRGRRFVKTCACDHGGFLRTRSPGRCSKAANRRRTSMGAATSGWIPDPAWCWHSFAGRKPSVGSSALPAGGHLVHGESPGRLVKRAASRGVDARESAEPVRVACAPCPGRTTDGRRSSRRAARALGRAQLTREGRRCVPLHGYRTALG